MRSTLDDTEGCEGRQDGARYLSTEGLPTGQEIDTLTTLNPFEHTPGEILQGL